jgi:hypothetical protein
VGSIGRNVGSDAPRHVREILVPEPTNCVVVALTVPGYTGKGLVPIGVSVVAGAADAEVDHWVNEKLERELDAAIAGAERGDRGEVAAGTVSSDSKMTKLRGRPSYGCPRIVDRCGKGMLWCESIVNCEDGTAGRVCEGPYQRIEGDDVVQYPSPAVEPDEYRVTFAGYLVQTCRHSAGIHFGNCCNGLWWSGVLEHLTRSFAPTSG